MDEVEDKATIHAIAIKKMHEQHKGILSSHAYQDKKTTWGWIGSGIAEFIIVYILKSFELNNELVIILFVVIAFLIGYTVGMVVFEGQFIEDKSLDSEGLFGKSQCPNTFCKSCGRKSYE